MSVLLSRRGIISTRIKASGSGPLVTSVVNATNASGNLVFASLPASSLSYLAILASADSEATAPTPPAGWTLLTSGSNTNNPAWSRWWAFVGSGSAAAGTWTMATNRATSGVIVGYDSATTITMPTATNQPSVDGNPAATLDSPSVTAAGDALVTRAVLFNSTSTTAVGVTPPASATLGRSTNTLTTSVERMTVSVASESKSAGSTGTGTWSLTGSGIYMPVAATFLVVKT